MNDVLTKLEDIMYENYIEISDSEATALVCFIKNHEREDIPDDVWDVCMRLMTILDIC